MRATKPGRPPAASARADHRAIEDALPSIGIAGPLIEDEDGAELIEVHYLTEEGIREKIVDGEPRRIAGEA